MAVEVFSYVQYWVVSLPPRFQVGYQNETERYFDWHLEQIKQCQGVEISPVERKMQVLKDQDGHDYAIRYDQKVAVTGTEEVLKSLRDRWDIR